MAAISGHPYITDTKLGENKLLFSPNYFLDFHMNVSELLAEVFPKTKRVSRRKKLPVIPGEYVDIYGLIWVLTENNIWFDASGAWADPKYNFLLIDRKFKPVQNP